MRAIEKTKAICDQTAQLATRSAKKQENQKEREKRRETRKRQRKREKAREKERKGQREKERKREREKERKREREKERKREREKERKRETSFLYFGLFPVQNALVAAHVIKHPVVKDGKHLFQTQTQNQKQKQKQKQNQTRFPQINKKLCDQTVTLFIIHVITSFHIQT
jgi:hypothetical protein